MKEVRAELHELAKKHDLPRLAELAEATRNRSPRVKAPPSSTPMTPELREEIRAMKKAHPEMTNQQIANHFNVNQGRVTDACRGKKK
jgi:hypothetical protein